MWRPNRRSPLRQLGQGRIGAVGPLWAALRLLVGWRGPSHNDRPEGSTDKPFWVILGIFAIKITVKYG